MSRDPLVRVALVVGIVTNIALFVLLVWAVIR
jgi:hypothetical protein